MRIEDKRTTKRIRITGIPLTAPPQTFWQQSLSVTVGSYRLLSGYPGYRNRIAQGLSATTSYLNEKYTHVYRRGYTTANGVHPVVKGLSGTATFAGINPVVPTIPSNPPNRIEADRQARVIVCKKISQANQNYDGLVFLGELRETIALIRNPARALRSRTGLFLSEQLKRARKNPKSFKKDIADSWLEFAFGVAPLINDIQSIAESANDVRDKVVKPVRAFAAVNSASTSQGANGVPGLPCVVYWTVDKIDYSSCLYVAGVEIKRTYDKSPLERIVSLGNFSLAGVAPAAWELVPWSFLVDYFSNVGDVIQGAHAATQKVVWWSKTTVDKSIRVDHSAYLKNTDKNWGLCGITDPPYNWGEASRIQRSATAASVSLMDVRTELPGFGTKWLNLAALSVNIFSKDRK